jgi:translocator assembly and maintenance protein 41
MTNLIEFWKVIGNNSRACSLTFLLVTWKEIADNMFRVIHRRLGARSSIRSLSTETVSSDPDPPPPPPPKPARKTRINPAPRRPDPPHLLSHLPLTFGRNQLLPVADSTRKLLESIVDGFDAPIRYAFAYGSGVFEQAGYSDAKPPMIDFVFAVSHPAHWHSINMAQHPGHYPLYTRALGSSFVSKVQEVNPGLWFNAYVPMNGVVRSFLPFYRHDKSDSCTRRPSNTV